MEFWKRLHLVWSCPRARTTSVKRVGLGNLAPPLQLPRFGVVGPDFLLVRGVSGISDVKPGLDYYYVTKAPSG